MNSVDCDFRQVRLVCPKVLINPVSFVLIMEGTIGMRILLLSQNSRLIGFAVNKYAKSASIIQL